MSFPAYETKKAELDALYAEAGPEMNMKNIKSISGSSGEKANYMAELQNEVMRLGLIGRKANASESASGRKDVKAGEWLASGIKAWAGSGTTNGGAFTPADVKSFFWDRLAAESVGLRSGFTVMTTAGDSVILPRVTADAAQRLGC